jgi:hypothetical protein
MRGVLLLLMGVALAACREDGATYRSDTGVVTASDQRPGDPVAGYTALMNAPYVSCGIPMEAFRRVVTEVDPSDLLPGRSGRTPICPMPSPPMRTPMA